MAVRKARSARKRKRKIKIKETAEIRKKSESTKKDTLQNAPVRTVLPSNTAIFKIKIKRKK